jgi:hypothetical protein
MAWLIGGNHTVGVLQLRSITMLDKIFQHRPMTDGMQYVT